ncbi:response regulator transcription factor [Ktedonosporobacter rubrisoli]|uniref:Response regulator transcription factor n=1 Tax=Ktedonosporobacter rubrisoli TaxID=2509675 RepID=A0A4P6JX50_KTERU|nr:response regulator transcription factor [Ktedonosporobacter rubrisoli]QBD79982.1 response regulator transcription factor [Ktedonosporobacter rubrisoli]
MSKLEKQSIRVLVVDDQQLVRDGIASLLHVQDGIEVIATATNGQQALEIAVTLEPDVILMDVRMPVMDGVEATGKIRQQVPACHILVLTTFDDDEYIKDALQAGASGYLLKDIPAADLALAVHAAAQGIYQLDPSIAGKMLAAFTPAKQKDKSQASTSAGLSNAINYANKASGTTNTGELTRREIEILRLIATGATNREIAEQLVISEGTVKNHISNVFSRLGLRDRTQAVMYIRELGLL